MRLPTRCLQPTINDYDYDYIMAPQRGRPYGTVIMDSCDTVVGFVSWLDGAVSPVSLTWKMLLLLQWLISKEYYPVQQQDVRLAQCRYIVDSAMTKDYSS